MDLVVGEAPPRGLLGRLRLRRRRVFFGVGVVGGRLGGRPVADGEEQLLEAAAAPEVQRLHLSPGAGNAGRRRVRGRAGLADQSRGGAAGEGRRRDELAEVEGNGH
uniref:Uncharacterized protein n=1 Tax=Arundo donax TaxID=35708 RepID=A0A0A9HQI8_ARUDO